MNKLIPLDQFVKKHKTLAAAARVSGLDYQALLRWKNRKTYALDHSAQRREAEARGIELPRRP